MIKHLAYHVTPFSHTDVWRRNVAQLLRRIEMFDGVRVVGVATGERCETLTTVQRLFASHRIDHWVTSDRCDARLRETPTFYPMLSHISVPDPGQATFYGHTKGVTHALTNRAITDWRNNLYHHLLDRWGEIEALLAAHPCVGAYRQYDHNLAAMGHLDQSLHACNWHYAGSFFWFRNDAVFRHPQWDTLTMLGYGVEFFLPRLFSYEQSACIYRDHPPEPYSDSHDHMPDADDWQSVFPSLVRVELGGGSTPLPDWINVDLCATADVRCDLQAVAAGAAVLPFPDASVDQLYSSHCLEHLEPVSTSGAETGWHRLLHEICRVCRVGAQVDIRVPHWNQNQAMSGLAGHRATLSHKDVDHLCKEFVRLHWGSSARVLRHLRTEYVPGIYFDEARNIFGRLGMTDEQIMRLIPDTCHETRFVFEVVNNA